MDRVSNLVLTITVLCGIMLASGRAAPTNLLFDRPIVSATGGGKRLVDNSLHANVRGDGIRAHTEYLPFVLKNRPFRRASFVHDGRHTTTETTTTRKTTTKENRNHFWKYFGRDRPLSVFAIIGTPTAAKVPGTKKVPHGHSNSCCGKHATPRHRVSNVRADGRRTQEQRTTRDIVAPKVTTTVRADTVTVSPEVTHTTTTTPMTTTTTTTIMTPAAATVRRTTYSSSSKVRAGPGLWSTRSDAKKLVRSTAAIPDDTRPRSITDRPLSGRFGRWLLMKITRLLADRLVTTTPSYRDDEYWTRPTTTRKWYRRFSLPSCLHGKRRRVTAVRSDCFLQTKKAAT